MSYRWCRALQCCRAAAAAAGQPAAHVPMRASDEHAAARRWLRKKVLASRILDDAESLDGWKMSFWSQGKGDLALTDVRARDGKHSVRLRSHTKGAKPSKGGGVFGSTAAVRAVAGEDWRGFNRLSFWVYPTLPGHHAVSLMVRLGNQGERLGRNTHHVLLENARWNHVVWEIPDVARDHVTDVAFTYVMNGNERGAAEVAQFDIDRLELERVEADHYEGWNVAPGRIAFSHTGYPTAARKTAVACGLEAGQFQIVRQDTGQAVLTKPVETVATRIGRFQVLDFSELRAAGTYRIRAGTRESLPFRIGDGVWERTIWKAVNFFYAERCGTAIPGVHAVCHADWRGEHQGKTIVINGGWHDAGDLSQGLVNTSEAVYAMFDLAHRLRERGGSPELARRLVEEAKWGLEWVLKTSFRDGHRVQWAVMRFWTNGVLGDVDDVTAKAQNRPSGSFYAAAAEAIAHRVLKRDEPRLAAKAMAMAREDWQFGAKGIETRPPESLDVELASMGVLASLELFKATGEKRYGEKARELARAVVGCQQKAFLPGLKVPITGFFHRTPRKRRRLAYLHRGHEQAPVVALAELCRVFPDDAEWMDWYAVVALHSRYYQQAMSTLTAPWHLLPNSLRHVDESRNKDAREQIANGFDVGGGYRVRVYPVQPSWQFRGNYGTVLSQAKAVAAAARLRRDAGLAALCREQLYWIVGRNPFAQSTMYGEGYDFAPQYTARSGDIVGSLPVGMKSLGNRDVPYWPFTNVWNYKEVWVHPVSRWLWLMCDLGVPGAALDAAAPKGGRALALSVEGRTQPDGRVAITLEARGAGRHTFALRAHNLRVGQATRAAELQAGRAGQVRWDGTVVSPGAPWVAVVVPDGRLDDRIEAIGSTRD